LQTFDYKDVYWPTIVNWEEIGTTMVDAQKARTKIAFDLYDEVEDSLQLIGEEYLQVWWTELS